MTRVLGRPPCETDADCDDGDPCTIDECIDGTCVHRPDPLCAGCVTDDDCAQGQVCRFGECVPDGGEPPTGETLTLSLGGGVTMELVRIPAGTFMMGTDSTDYSWLEQSRPVHSVTISRDFYIGRYEVTQAQWQAVMGSNPSYFSGCDECPVEEVSWNDAVDFCDAVSSMTGYEIRLPSEAEWEYACRAGTTTEYSFGDNTGDLGNYAWYDGNSNSQTHEVGMKLPNSWGLYDMHGNVWEWCNDWYDGSYYSTSPSTDPEGPSSGTNRVHRGGSYCTDPNSALRSANRGWNRPDHRTVVIGCRVAAGT